MVWLCNVVSLRSKWQETHSEYCAHQKVISLDLLKQL